MRGARSRGAERRDEGTVTEAGARGEYVSGVNELASGVYSIIRQ